MQSGKLDTTIVAIYFSSAFVVLMATIGFLASLEWVIVQLKAHI